MKEEDLTINEFKRLIPRVKCISLFHYNLFNEAKLAEICKVSRLELESPGEMESIGDANLVWYVNDRGERVWWDTPGARNMVLGSLARQYAKAPSGMDEKLRGMVDSIRGGVAGNIELICVRDTSLGVTVLVDGVYRGLALYYMYLTEPETLKGLMAPSSIIRVVTLRTPAGAMLFPCDFVNICKKAGTAD